MWPSSWWLCWELSSTSCTRKARSRVAVLGSRTCKHCPAVPQGPLGVLDITHASHPIPSHRSSCSLPGAERERRLGGTVLGAQRLFQLPTGHCCAERRQQSGRAAKAPSLGSPKLSVSWSLFEPSALSPSPTAEHPRDGAPGLGHVPSWVSQTCLKNCHLPPLAQNQRPVKTRL